MFRNILFSLICAGFVSSLGFAAAGNNELTFQQEFLQAARSLSERQIIQKLQQPDIAAQEDLRGYHEVLNAELAYRLGLVKLAQNMLDVGFFHDYQKIILTALLDFKRYAVNHNPYSLKPGERSPLLFDYINPAGQRTQVTTYSFVYLILDQLQEALNRHFQSMYSVRLKGSTIKLKEFLKELSRPQGL